MKIEEIINYLQRLSDAKFVLMENLLKITGEQHRALEKEDWEVMDNLIQQKQKIMDKIDLLDKEFIEKYDILKKDLGIKELQEIDPEKLPGVEELKKKINRILEVVKKIQELDQENTQKIKKNITKAKENLKTIKTGRKAFEGYNSSYRETYSIFFDKKK
ncbi:FlgN protein [Anaerovirgula multivorans]|uniref:FlgN protein n=1 Tax=Anaerovirgula multivorans TaxID=312168 RepID=A0A239EUF2_9FIRM|nr:flagellar protein FlgN [Anaerovirgula multivorans]SNS48285.1 FlgN protein [Anaerovirgula multivorans]